ncbi:hypothetical protein ACFXP3_35010, partial [Streptomyces sp. NPDC059096]
MSEHPEHTQQTRPTQHPERGRGGPEPEAIRFFGTTWLARDGGYAARRAAVAAGARPPPLAAGV